MGIKKRISKLAANFDASYDKLSLELRKRFNSNEKLQIVTYRSYGTVNRMYIKGRVLADKGITKSVGDESLWKNIVNMYRRFESDEVPGAKLKVTFQNEEHFVITDNEGYFVYNLFTEKSIVDAEMWHEVKTELVDAPYSFKHGIKSTANVLIPPADAEYGIISDIDDTVVKTGATSLIAMSRNTFFHNAHSRMPFAGVSEFYKSLQLGRNGKRNNPFFYVSSSPWNLYDLLVDFLDINDIPEGPLLLRDFGIDDDKSIADHMGHKFHEIQNILLTYPHLKFVLIGDSGQEDPNIYKEVVSKFPDRILAVYIRDVQLKDREKIAMDISKSIEKIEMVIVDNTIEAAKHAAKIGLIFNDALDPIVHDKKQDKGETPGKEEITLTTQDE
jgi:phosphatidate phosphatase APP1